MFYIHNYNMQNIIVISFVNQISQDKHQLVSLSGAVPKSRCPGGRVVSGERPMRATVELWIKDHGKSRQRLIKVIVSNLS